MNYRNIKIRIKDEKESIAVQTFLFKHKVSWWDGTRTIEQTDSPFLYVNHRGTLEHGSTLECFLEVEEVEVTVKELLGNDKLTNLKEELLK